MKKKDAVKKLKQCFTMMDSEISDKVISHNEKVEDSSKLINTLSRVGLIMSPFSIISLGLVITSLLFFSGKMSTLFIFLTFSFLSLMVVFFSMSYNLFEKLESRKLNKGTIFDFLDEDEDYEVKSENNVFLKNIVLPKETYFAIYQKIKDIIGAEKFETNIEYVVGASKMEDIGNAYFVKMVIHECISYLDDEDEDDKEWDETVKNVKEKSLNNLYSSLS